MPFPLPAGAAFDRVGPALAAAGCYVVAFDLPGHGMSSHRPRYTFYHGIEYATTIVDVADHLGWDEFVLVGHSLGGAFRSSSPLSETPMPHSPQRLLLRLTVLITLCSVSPSVPRAYPFRSMFSGPELRGGGFIRGPRAGARDD